MYEEEAQFMVLQEGDFITLSYTGNIAGSIFDTTDEEVAKEAGIYTPEGLYGPVTIRVGSHHVILGLDEALVGKEVGFEGEVEVGPDKAFGPHDPKRVEAFNKKAFKEKPRIGMHLSVDEKGEGTVVDVIGNRVLLDFNHPFAGKELHYWYRIESHVTSVEEKVNGLIRLYAGRVMETAFADGILTITLPPGINYDRRWVLWRSRVIGESLEYIPEINEITLVETFKRKEEEE